MESPDRYRVLQVDPSADVEVIRAAYRVLARRFHPDVHDGDAIMRRLNAAWEVLQNADRRAAYNRTRTGLDRRADPSTSPSSGASAAPAATVVATAPEHAGPPVGTASGTVFAYGRYEGWSIGQVAAHDPNFLEWLRSVPGGRSLRDEIDAALRESRTPRPGWTRGTRASDTDDASRFRRAGVLIG